MLPAAEIEEREEELLIEAKAVCRKFCSIKSMCLSSIISVKILAATAWIPNITGRYPTPYAHGGPDVTKMVVLDLTDESEGNANGVGTADLRPSDLWIRRTKPGTYANGLTSTVCAPTKIATTLENDMYAIKAAVKTCNILDYTKCRLVRIQDTLHLGEIEISVNLLDEARKHPDIEIFGSHTSWTFDERGEFATHD